MHFPDEIWHKIICYAGFISITVNWDLTKLTIDELINIIKNNVNANVEHDNIINTYTHRISSLQKYLIPYFWKNVNKNKLLEIYQDYSNVYCSHDYKLYNHHNVYLLTNNKRKISFQFNGKVMHNNIYLDRPCKVINVTNKLVEFESLDKYTQDMQIILVFNLVNTTI